MPSSISNSSSRAPNSPYLKIWITAVLLLTLMVLVAEFFWRNQGHLPSISDDQFLWTYNRSQVYSQDENRVITLLGGSRIQLGIVPEKLDVNFPEYQTIHLAIDGTSGYAVFEDLAKDQDFDGLIIMSATVAHFFPSSQDDQQPWVEYYHEQWSSFSWIEKYINMKVRVFLQNHLVIFSSHLNLRRQLMNSFDSSPNYVLMRENRYRAAYYYDRMSPEQLAEHRAQRIDRIGQVPDNQLNPEQEQVFEQIMVGQVSSLVEEMRSHGGDVIFLRMPTCDEHWELDEIRFPKEQYWDRIEELTGANTIHFKDVESLSNFDCPDTSHLDANDALVFTERLANELEKMNFIQFNE